MYLLFLHPVMAKYFLSIILFFLATTHCYAAANNVSDEYQRLRNTSNKTLINKAIYSIGRNNSDSALIYFYAVVNRYRTGNYKEKDLTDIVRAIQDIGIVYMTYIYDYKKSYDYLLEAKEIAEKNNLEKCLPSIYNCIANILQVSKQDGDKKESSDVVNMLRKSFYTAVKTKEYETMNLSIDNLIAIGMWKGRKDVNIEKEISTFCSINKKSNMQETKNSIMLCNAYTAHQKGNDKAAIDIIEKLTKSNCKNPLAYRELLTNRGLISVIYINNKQYDKAINTLKVSLSIAKKHKSIDYEASLYRNLWETYEEKGDSTNAQNYELLYHRTKEKLRNDGNLSSVKNVKFIRELNKANEQVLELSAKRRTQNIIIACSLTVVCIIGTLLYRLYRANRKIQQNNRHLYRTNVELLTKEEKAREERILSENTIQDLQKKIKEIETKNHPQTTKQEHLIPTTNDTTENSENRTEANKALQRQKYLGSRMTDEETKELYLSVLNVMETSNEIFRIGFNIDMLSDLVHSRSRYVSQAINQESGSNFNVLLNEYRIKEACRRLNGNPKFANMTIESIAESVGFKSRTSFGALFKSITGLSPSAYQRLAKEKQDT